MSKRKLCFRVYIVAIPNVGRRSKMLAQKTFILDLIIISKKKFIDFTLSNIPPTNTTSSFSTSSTSSINRRSTGLNPYIYSRLWLFQIETAASGTEAESICLFRTSFSFRVHETLFPFQSFS